MVERKDAAVAEAAARRPWREADVRVLLEAWRESGQTLTAFARRYAVHPERLARWHRLLRRKRPRSVRFHPVRVRPLQTRLAHPDERIEVVVRDGCAIRVPPGFDADELRRVVAVLTAAEAGC